MIGTEDARTLLCQRGWLSQTPAAFQHDVLDRCRMLSFAAGERVYAVGSPPGGIYGLLAGSLGVTVATDEHAPYLAHLARPGDWFGEASLFTGEPRRVGLTALRETVLFHFPLQEIHALLARDPSAWRLFGLITIGHLDTAMGAFNDLAIRDPEQRCVATILRLGGVRWSNSDDSSPIEIHMSQQELAVIASVARTTVNTVLRRLEKAGHLALSYRYFSITAPTALRAMLDE